MRGGIAKSNYIVDATDAGAGNDKWDSTTVQTWTVPDGHTWLFYGGSVKNSVDHTVVCNVHDADDNIVLGLCTIAAPGAGVRVQYPDSDIGYVVRPIVMSSGWYVKLTMGAAQGAAAEATCLVTEYLG